MKTYSNPQTDIDAVSHGETSAPPVSSVPSTTESLVFDITDLGTVSTPSSLSHEQKYQILTNISPKLKEYPVNSQKRRFQPQWCESFPWIRYSVSVDGVFCAPCSLFSRARNSEFVATPFCNWKNATGATHGSSNRHSSSHTHQQCVEQAASFRGVVEQKADSIKSQLSVAYDKQVQINTAALLAIVDSILFLIKQGIGLRGSNWDKPSKREDGNFSHLLDFLSKYCLELQSHIAHSSRNARYLSTKIQNEFIAINGDMIRKSIVAECNSSRFWSIMADETTDVSTKEQVSVCVRYIRKIQPHGLEVCEEFLGFCSVSVANAEAITSAITGLVEGAGLIMDRLVGKGFDGASTMSGHVSGVSARLQDLYPKAKYFTHCRNHALNLVLIAGCNNVPVIRNFMQTFKELTLFFKFSAKIKHILVEHFKSSNDREDLLADCADDELIPNRKHQGLPVLSDTRWLTRVDSIDCLLGNYRSVCEAVEEVRDSSTGQSTSDADSYLKRLLSFEFLVSAIICWHILAFTRPLTVALQAKECDIYKAYKMAQRLVTSLENERDRDRFTVCWQEILKCL